MAKLYSAASGEIVAIRETPADEAAYPLPDDVAHVLEFDPTTNPAILPTLAEDWTAYRLEGTTLTTRAGATVPVQAEGEATQDARELPSVVSDIRAYLSAAGDQRTAAQRMAFERNVGRVLRHLVRQLA